MAQSQISVSHVQKSFRVGNQDVVVLKDVSLEVEGGDFLVIIGPSGCGKSTLLHSMLGLEPPSQGEISMLGTRFYFQDTEDDRSVFRKKHVGMVYQQANWIKSLTVVENVAFPLLLLGYDKIDAINKSLESLKSLGIENWASFIPTELSSGQQQKAALARAIVTNPEIIVADEPTGNLDFKSGQELMDLLANFNKQGKTVVMVTHDLEYLKYAKTAIKILDGRIEETYHQGQRAEMLKNIKSKRGTSNLEKDNA